MKKPRIAKKKGLVAAAPPAPAEPTNEEIAQLAHQLWEQAGRPHGQDLAHWYEAETRLRQPSQPPGAGQASSDAPAA